ncbi:protoheme IX farnesyltransferase [Cyclonatronum proteinivorum]|uniref:Protoheme IX farnesyltransferase n=1 Tax=Cyclonatronum proteinivorum TaxID=1457365 RepID=A0A345UP07_9BACT|nr:heme o synthase [Cyclonatronum proteinivorum]AXJ02209.1 protoheme IX farnesyltransferase [Cyclonatronum proteinivorum]
MKLTQEKTLSKPVFSQALSDYFELTKPGITVLVLASMAIGFLLGSAGTFDFTLLFHAIIGTVLIAAGTAAHNQYIERDLDKLMLRTSKRPLPMERIKTSHALIFSMSMIFGGLIYLIATVNWVAGMVSALTAFSYLAMYTPMKRVSFSNVWIGAVPGALPPVGGWAAATGTITEPGVWVLFAIVFFWQVPHVVSIAWLCNDDYTRAGFRMLPKNDEAGYKAAWVNLSCLIILIPISVSLYFMGYNGMIYLAGALLAGAFFFYYGYLFFKNKDKDSAKKLMFASIFYLPIVWIVILLDVLIG